MKRRQPKQVALQHHKVANDRRPERPSSERYKHSLLLYYNPRGHGTCHNLKSRISGRRPRKLLHVSDASRASLTSPLSRPTALRLYTAVGLICEHAPDAGNPQI